MSRTACQIRGRHNWVLVMNSDQWRPEAIQCGDWDCGERIAIPPADDIGVEQALDVLEAAGWEVRDEKGYGHLTDTDPPLLVMTHYDPTAADHMRTVAQENWKPVTEHPGRVG